MFSICQRYALKANHNRHRSQSGTVRDVFNMSKIRFESKSQPHLPRREAAWRCFQYVKDTLWKQITTTSGTARSLLWCFQYVKDTLWKQITTVRPSGTWRGLMFSICQRYALKANHNNLAVVAIETGDVFNMSKIRFESKSQRYEVREDGYLDVFNMSKIRFESKSQLMWRLVTRDPRCFQYVKDTLWKQITTNCLQSAVWLWCFQYVKDTLWKQITTSPSPPAPPPWCFQYVKDTLWKQMDFEHKDKA